MATATEGKTGKQATKKQAAKPETVAPEVQSLESAAATAYQQAIAMPRPPLDPEKILTLQRTVGNQAVQRLLLENQSMKQSERSLDLAHITPGGPQITTRSEGATPVLQREVAQEGEEPAESTEEAPQAGQNLRLGLVDQNPDHMLLPTDLGTFRAAADSWSSRSSGQVFPVMDSSGVTARLNSVLAADPASTLTHLALFGHGSSRSGWVHMGDLGAILLAPGVVERLAPDLRVILYMCLAGADPGTTYETRNRAGETVEAPGETGEEEGGLQSYAARLSASLSAQVPNVQVWAHTTRAHTTLNPNWRVFGGPPSGEATSPGDPFFRHVFDDEFVDNLVGYIGQYRRRSDDCPHRSLRRHVWRNRERVLEWLYDDFVRLTGGGTHGPERAMWAPMEPDAVAQEVRNAWLERYGLTIDELAPAPAAETPEAASEAEEAPEQEP